MHNKKNYLNQLLILTYQPIDIKVICEIMAIHHRITYQ